MNNLIITIVRIHCIKLSEAVLVQPFFFSNKMAEDIGTSNVTLENIGKFFTIILFSFIQILYSYDLIRYKHYPGMLKNARYVLNLEIQTAHQAVSPFAL